MSTAPILLHIRDLPISTYAEPEAARQQADDIFGILAGYVDSSSSGLSDTKVADDILSLPHVLADGGVHPILNLVVLELAKQIPADHEGQLKLAKVMWSIDRNPKRLEKMGNEWHQTLRDEIVRRQPVLNSFEGHAVHLEMVRHAAFVANLAAVGFWKIDIQGVKRIMNLAFQLSAGSGPRATWAVQETYTLVAAQMILSLGCMLFLQIGKAYDVWDWQLNDYRVANPWETFTLQMWQNWKSFFLSQSWQEEFRQVARRRFAVVHELMTSLETAHQVGVTTQD